MSQRFLVEFVGPPAAGKTTLSRAIATSLESDSLEIQEPTRIIAQKPRPRRIATKSRYALERLLCDPRASLTEPLSVYRSQKSPIDALKVGFNWQYLCGLTRHTSGDVALLDQGIFQALWSIGYRSHKSWETDLRTLSVPDEAMPDLVVIVQAGEDTLQARLETDRDSTTRVSERRAEIRRSIDGIEHLQALIDEYDIKSIEVDNTSEAALQRARETVSDRIRCIYEQRA